jgi:predicted metal-dependent hydrolase
MAAMSRKSAKIAALIERHQGRELAAHYLGYFECFNRGWYYDAHDVLEELWLLDRHGPSGAFYKGLIQFAGAFVHMQKHTPQRPRLRPAAALLELARVNLQNYPGTHEHLNLVQLLGLIEDWRGRLQEHQFLVNPLSAESAPILRLLP